MVNININFSNKWLYTLIIIGIFGFIGVLVNASDPTLFGHTIDELGAPAGCLSGQVLMWDGIAWYCDYAEGAPVETYDWFAYDWSDCSGVCDFGTQTRAIECRSSDGTAVTDNLCPFVEPSVTQVCEDICSGTGCNSCEFDHYYKTFDVGGTVGYCNLNGMQGASDWGSGTLSSYAYVLGSAPCEWGSDFMWGLKA